MSLALLGAVLLAATDVARAAFPGGDGEAIEGAAAASAQPILLGVFPQGELTNPDAMDELRALDDWSKAVGGARTSIAGTFIDLEVGYPEFNVFEQLERAWVAGYTPMVKIGTSRTTAEVAAGRVDGALYAWARVLANWTTNRTRTVFIAPFPEMNGRGNAYSLDPPSFRAAFKRIQSVFASSGVPDRAVRWVFAPNGWSDPADPPFEDYYPDGADVDVVGFSQYNWGYCPGTQWDSWDDPTSASDSLFRQYLPRIRALAPSKPVFLLQTASTAQSPKRAAMDPARKNEWLRALYAWAADEGVRGIMYFNSHKECDWEVFKVGGVRFEGYRQAVRDPRYAYLPPDALASTALAAAGPCVPTATAMCLQGGRFRVEISWSGFAGDGGQARVVAGGTTDSGLFYFYGPNNWELLVKVLDGCAENDRFWVFSAAATNLAYTLTVTDTRNGATRTYANPLGKAGAAITDTQAFDTCS